MLNHWRSTVYCTAPARSSAAWPGCEGVAALSSWSPTNWIVTVTVEPKCDRLKSRPYLSLGRLVVMIASSASTAGSAEVTSSS